MWRWNTFQWNIVPNSKVFFQGNAFENIVGEMAAILFLPQCAKPVTPGGVYMQQRSGPFLVQVMAWCRTSDNNCLSRNIIQEIWIKMSIFSFKQMHLKCCLQNGCHLFNRCRFRVGLETYKHPAAIILSWGKSATTRVVNLIIIDYVGCMPC